MDSPVLTCAMTFLAVLVPYLVVSFCMRSPKPDGESSSRSLPLLFRVAWGYISAISASIGPSFEANNPTKARKYRKIVLMSGYHLSAADLYAGQIFTSVAAALVFGIGLFILSGKAKTAFAMMLVGAFLGWVYPRMVVERRGRQRQMEIIRSLPFAIDLLASAMRAGLDFLAAVRYYVKIGSGALAVEFGLLLKQLELGKSRLDALEEMAEHVQTPEFTAFVGAVAHGTERGASIIDTLVIQSEDMRRARFNLAELKAARAPSIMIFPIALFILPAVFTIIFVPVFLKFKAAKGG